MNKIIRICERCSEFTEHYVLPNSSSVCRVCRQQRNKDWMRANPHLMRAAQMRSRYGAAAENIRPVPECCEACGRRSEVRLHFDHDHVLNVFRGWLCRACNRGIGLLGDNAVTVRKALEYLERFERLYVGEFSWLNE